MQLAYKIGIEDTTVFHSPRVILPMKDDEKSQVLSSLSPRDALILGSSAPASVVKLPCPSLVLDEVNLLGLLDLSSYDRVVLANLSDEDEILAAVDGLGSEKPAILYSCSEQLDGIIPRDFMRWDSHEEMFLPSFELDEDMLHSALGAFLSSAANACSFCHHRLATGTASMPDLTREDLRRSVSVMSCGHVGVSASVFSQWIVALDIPTFEAEVTALARASSDKRIIAQIEALEQVTALRDLLDTAYGNGSGLFDGFTMTLDQILAGFRRTDKEISDTLRENGMESFLDAISSGVPVEDLFA